MSLTADDFPTFVRAVHDHDPFPWQADLAARILTDRAWPDLIDVPTGLGKTSLLDIAVFVAAATSDRVGADRVGRRRCFFVVDRRLVVDEAYGHARRIIKGLANPDGILADVASGLRAYAPQAGGELLRVTRMRGGTTWDRDWLDRPDRPGIVVGTVDQVGSRLLFRGYGVSERRRSLEAAFAGTDTLLVIDEAHLSVPLTKTVEAARERDTCPLPVPGVAVVRMTATSGVASSRSYVLDPAAHADNEVAHRRLTAGKVLLTVETDVGSCAKVMADLAKAHATASAGQSGDASTVLVTCNTIRQARAIHGRLLDQGITTDLLIGRTRPYDREGLQDRLNARFGIGRSAVSEPAILVATQTVEVGVNLDVDVLITESAPWDSLVQRLGRLNRDGRAPQRRVGGGPALAIVVHDGQADGPVYGEVRDACWAELIRLSPPVPARAAAVPGRGAPLAVSPLACRHISRSMPPTAMMSPPHVPFLMTPTLDAWTETGPAPVPDPPVAPYLHGFTSPSATVEIAWRDGLLADPDLDDLVNDTSGETSEPARGARVTSATAHALLSAVPVRAGEVVEVPFAAARAWLAGDDPPPVADVDLDPDAETRPPKDPRPIRALALRARLPGVDPTWRWIDASGLRPGDRIVVPAEDGGLDQYGWAPTGREPVTDLGDEVALFSSGRPALRLDRNLPNRLLLPEPARTGLAAAARAAQVASATDEAEQAALTALRHALLDALERAANSPEAAEPRRDRLWTEVGSQFGTGARLIALADPRDPITTRHSDTRGRPIARLLVARADSIAHLGGQPVRDDIGEVTSSLAARQVPLTVHHQAARDRARQIASALGLPRDLIEVAATAAGMHDLGKVEERFQINLHGGDAVAALLAEEPLAKSGMDPDDRAAWRRARELARLPRGARHEAWSAALVASLLDEGAVPPTTDDDLLLHLIASHHGHARPLLPPVVDDDARPIQVEIAGVKVEVDSAATVDLDHPGRFARLNARYGRWGLALLEAVVRCADMTVSEEGS
jgi:CRISPR-associated endonuclease/helicase Cas3